MNKKLGLILVAGFLSAQFLTFLHMAEHVFEKHEHDEDACRICLNWEHTKYNTHSDAVAFDVSEHFVFVPSLPELLFARSESYRVAFPRGPPLFS